MYKKRMGGRRCRTSGLLTAKSISIKGTDCRSGGCALQAIDTYLGRSAVGLGNETEGRVIGPDRAAEVSLGRSSVDSPGNREGAKARTVPARG